MEHMIEPPDNQEGSKIQTTRPTSELFEASSHESSRKKEAAFLLANAERRVQKTTA